MKEGDEMKKTVALLLCLCVAFSLAACGNESAEETDTPSSTISPSETVTEPTAQAAAPDGDSNILIAYFTWAENTVVDNPDEVDVDATTSASVLPPGNAARMAGWIGERVGGDLFSIVVTEPYSSDYDECLDRAADEKAENARPELVNHIENMEDYDIVFLGFPNWWYTVPMAIHSFLEEYDFSGKTVIPFVTHGTGGLSSTIRDMTSSLPASATVLDAIGVYRPEVDQSQPAVLEWLDGLGFTEESQQETGTGGDEAEMEQESGDSSESSERRLILSVEGHEIPIVLYDTPAADALYDMLPLELSFEDYNGIEKISYLPESIPTDGEPESCDPDVGSFCLYAPWGNLSIFYQDFRVSNGLIMLGHIESGIEILAGMSQDFTATLTAAAD